MLRRKKPKRRWTLKSNKGVEIWPLFVARLRPMLRSKCALMMQKTKEIDYHHRAALTRDCGG